MDAGGQCMGRLKHSRSHTPTNKPFEWNVMKGFPSLPKRANIYPEIKHWLQYCSLESWKNPEFNTLSTFFDTCVGENNSKPWFESLWALCQWRDFWNYCLHHVLATCWNRLSTQRNPHCGGSTSEAPLARRVSNSTKCQPSIVTTSVSSLKIKRLTAQELFNDVSVWMEIKITCQLPSKATGIFILLNVKGMSVSVLPQILCECGKCQQFCCRRCNEAASAFLL